MKGKENKKAVLIHLDIEIIKDLKHMAVNDYKDLKNYIQDVLIKMVNKQREKIK